MSATRAGGRVASTAGRSSLTDPAASSSASATSTDTTAISPTAPTTLTPATPTRIGDRTGSTGARTATGRGIDFYLPGKPVPQGSKIKTRFGMREDNANLAPWREALVWTIRQAMAEQGATMMDGAILVEVEFCFARPASHYGTGRNAGVIKPSAPGAYHAVKPDGDKLCRALFDALTIAGAIRDDNRVAHCEYRKLWAPLSYLSAYVGEI